MTNLVPPLPGGRRDLEQQFFQNMILEIRRGNVKPEFLRDFSRQPFSDRLLQAVQVGMLDIDPVQKTATILGPPRLESLSDDDWLAVLGAASELHRELEALGYRVEG
jgi:hypothetical protein